ncbi:MAG: hypothetical protein K2Y05_07275, partial [Hyphomicrobiaceae bacterium]|nr:hypothetical protein [Hyphomicrobiaceae bacterium]
MTKPPKKAKPSRAARKAARALARGETPALAVDAGAPRSGRSSVRVPGRGSDRMGAKAQGERGATDG